MNNVFKFYYKTIGLLTAVLMLLFIFLGFSNYHSNLENYKNEIFLGKIRMLNNFKESVDGIIKAIDKNIIGVLYDTKMQEYYISSLEPDNIKRFKRIQAIRLISEFDVSNDEVVSAYFCLNRDQTVLFKTVFEKDSFFDRTFITSIQQKQKSMQPTYEFRTLPAYGENNASIKVLTLYRWAPVNSSSKVGLLIVNIDIEKILNNMNSGIPENSWITVYDLQKNNFIFHEEELNEDKGFINKLGINLKSLDIKKTEMVQYKDKIAFYSKSNIGEYAFILAVIEKSILPMQATIVRNSLISYSIGFAVCTIILMIMSIILFKPVSKIYRMIKGNENALNRTQMKGKAEDISFKDIASRVEKVLLNNRDLNEQIMQYNEMLKERFLLQLLSGTIEKKDDIIMKMKKLNISFPHTSFIVIKVELEHMNKIVDQISSDIYSFLIMKIKHSIDYSIPAAAVTEVLCENESSYYIVLNFESSDHTGEYIKRICRSIKKNLHNTLKIQTVLGVGKIQNDIQKLYYSKVLANEATKYRYLLGMNTIINYERVQPENKEIDEALKIEISHVTEVIITGKADLIRESLLKLKRCMIINKCSISRCNSIQTVIIGEIRNMLESQGFTITKTLKEIQKTRDDFIDFNDFIRYASNIVSNIHNMLKNQLRTMDQNLYKKIISYIENHQADKKLSIENIASDNYISKSFLCKLFKEMSNKTVFEHITELRIEQARRILVGTDLSLKQISDKVGYNDSRSLIRYFKNTFGVTPTEYRNIHKIQ